MNEGLSIKNEAKVKKKRWTDLSNGLKIEDDFGFPKGFLKVLVNREVLEEKDLKNQKKLLEKIDSFLNPDYEKELNDPFLLPDMKAAVERILLALEKKEKIAVYGDYDVDGTTSSAVLGDIFNVLKADFTLYIPSRHEEGYGLNKNALKNLKEKGVNLVITVDCGIKSFEETEYASEIGLDIIITDHHECEKNQKSKIKSQKSKSKVKNLEEQKIPKALAVINPKRDDSKYPFKELAGVGVAFKLACAVLQGLEKKNRLKDCGITTEYAKWLLDLVMIGTICDIVPLKGENRALAHFGFKVIERTRREGLKALVAASGNDLAEIQAHNVGFHLGPRLNASGRLEHADLSLKLLTAKDGTEAQKLAQELNNLNAKRQSITQEILIEAKEYLKNYDDKKIVLMKSENWPKGIVGIVASRLVEDCGKPVILFEEKPGLLEGSARSIKNFDIVAALDLVKEHLVRFGGHKKAAGLSLKTEHFIILEEKLLKIAEDKISEEDLVSEIIIDSEVELKDINNEFFNYLKKMEPFGYGNEAPKFVINGLMIKELKKVGKEQKHIKLVVSDGAKEINGIFFNGSLKGEVKVGDKIDAVCQITENVWMNRRSIEIRIIDIKVAE